MSIEFLRDLTTIAGVTEAERAGTGSALAGSPGMLEGVQKECLLTLAELLDLADDRDSRMLIIDSLDCLESVYILVIGLA